MKTRIRISTPSPYFAQNFIRFLVATGICEIGEDGELHANAIESEYYDFQNAKDESDSHLRPSIKKIFQNRPKKSTKEIYETLNIKL